ncbi:hypothetical protein [Haloplanus rubicundus]|uniref:Uncharacterized protein n=1 Tax=Haloplanus rubicundus TaxID=1547898 RepID=A0A345EH54_9EURY|nr:hypothetical protein [Haloplanus rubicundus]AXG11526.1 hypothetical protein DU484_17620 [Haloplanus rubicundus]
MPSRYTRRQLVVLAAAVGAGLAGCTSPAEPSSDDADGDATGTETTGETAADELDLREANVVAVEFERRSDGYRFDVTLIHDDDGEDGYANWWQVETLDGERLGRRELAHPHGTREFTRSATVSVPEDTTCVVVRGHDETHGYGGQATLVNVESGATSVVRQGSERDAMDGRACP